MAASKKDSPGVYIPPPLFYVLIFLTALFIQKRIWINDSFFHLQLAKGMGIMFLTISLLFLVTSLRKFFLSKNTLILIKPASSLQTNGIYRISRNPMYVGLLFLYLGITCFIGNWWNVILLPVLFLIIQQYVIRSEEKYLTRAFGEEFLVYKNNVRRWL
jgi:protein-S-isoprenylcysteine O-methyltransferase Ste14